MDFSNKLYIDIPNLSSKVKVEDNLFVIVEDLSKIYNYSKLLQDYSIKSGTLVVEVIDDKNINFDAMIEGFDLPLYKDESKVSELSIEGSIKEKSVNISSKDNTLKFEVNDDVNLFLKDYKIVDNFSKKYPDLWSKMTGE